jgi:hypothetical protein
MDQLEIVECQDVDTFIGELRLTNPAWGGGRAKDVQWIFRGHGEEDWPLCPSLWRPRAYELYFPLLSKLETTFNNKLFDWTTRNRRAFTIPLQPVDEPAFERHVRLMPCGTQLACEISLVKEFAILVDKLGMTVPDATLLTCDLQELALSNLSKASSGLHIELPSVHTICLAQHHGIPTRFLDWTDNPLVAAFFASEGVDYPTLLRNLVPAERAFTGLTAQRAEHGGAVFWREETPPTGRLAVWALKVSSIDDPAIDIMRVPNSLSPYLYAQRGLFTCDRLGDTFYLDQGRRPYLTDRIDVTKLRKIVLPKAEVANLRHALFLENVSRAHMMPTLDNVISTLRKKWEWEYPF